MLVAAAVAVMTLITQEGDLVPTERDGLIAESTVASLSDEHLPAIAHMNDALKRAMRAAESAAAADGIYFEVTSGWRSTLYQEWLMQDAIGRYGSVELARQFVATPDESSHVTGDAVDIGPLDAQFWLIQYGAEYGICQTYANERWHFQLATTPGGECPQMRQDASS